MADSMADCICTIEHVAAIGTHDRVTGEWLPEQPTTHILFTFNADCPMHQNPIACYECGRTTCDPRLKPGWAIRCDGQVAACTRHTDHMPPHV